MDKKIRTLIVILVLIIGFIVGIFLFNIFGNAERNRFVGTWKKESGIGTYIFRSDGSCDIPWGLGHKSGRYSIIETKGNNLVNIVTDDGSYGDQFFYKFSENDTRLRFYWLTYEPYGSSTSGFTLIKQ